MPQQQFDAIVIGAGQSGPSLAARFAGLGWKTALIERKHLGGTCVNNGCIPTKTLVASARAAHVVRRAGEFGVSFGGGPVTVDMKAVKARKDAVVAHSVNGLTGWLEGMANLTLIRGQARFTGPDRVQVGDEVLTAPKIFVNVGGRAVVPEWPGIHDVPYLTNASMMDVDFLPEHLVIVGGSYIGLEFAQMYARFGSKVTVLQASPRLIAREDPEVSAEILALLQAEGVDVRLSVDGLSMARDGAGVRVMFGQGESASSVTGSHLLLAVGREPNTADLGAEAAGLKLDKHGYIEVDDELRSNVPGIWAIGDVNGRGAFTHTSYNDYEIVAANLLDGGSRKVSDRITAYGLFIDPPLGRIGMTEAEVRKTGRPSLVATMPMSRVGRANERSETTGFMKVLVDAESKRILGASLLGIEADEVVHVLLMVMSAGQPYTLVQRTMAIHPTVSELLPTLFERLEPLQG